MDTRLIGSCRRPVPKSVWMGDKMQIAGTERRAVILIPSFVNSMSIAMSRPELCMIISVVALRESRVQPKKPFASRGGAVPLRMLFEYTIGNCFCRKKKKTMHAKVAMLYVKKEYTKSDVCGILAMTDGSAFLKKRLISNTFFSSTSVCKNSTFAACPAAFRLRCASERGASNVARSVAVSGYSSASLMELTDTTFTTITRKRLGAHTQCLAQKCAASRRERRIRCGRLLSLASRVRPHPA
mmetsp:Transcript_53500/g.100349  ORF Transcript_53500/g.100349 Transcript_53500/m.100349 type:complete len:241 (+) Transcript_53500:1914-2636(+)